MGCILLCKQGWDSWFLPSDAVQTSDMEGQRRLKPRQVVQLPVQQYCWAMASVSLLGELSMSVAHEDFHMEPSHRQCRSRRQQSWNAELLGKSSMPFEKLKLDNTSGLILPVFYPCPKPIICYSPADNNNKYARFHISR